MCFCGQNFLQKCIFAGLKNLQKCKSGKDYTIHRALDRFVSNEDYHIQKALVLSNGQKVRVEGKMLYLPIYYVMFLRPSSPKQVIL